MIGTSTNPDADRALSKIEDGLDTINDVIKDLVAEVMAKDVEISKLEKQVSKLEDEKFQLQMDLSEEQDRE